jgi:YD repeat-containing protein
MTNKIREVYSVKNRLQNAIDAADGVTTYSYDFWDRLTTFTDQRGNSTVYGYDLLGRLVSETNPLNKTTRYAYNDSGGCSSCGTGGAKIRGRLRNP